MENYETMIQETSAVDEFDKSVEAAEQKLASLDGIPRYAVSEDNGLLSISKTRLYPGCSSAKTDKGKPNSLPIGVLKTKHTECPANDIFKCHENACNAVNCARWATLSQFCRADCHCEVLKRESLTAHVNTSHSTSGQGVDCAVCRYKFQSLHHADRHYHEQHNLEGELYVCIHKSASGQRCGHIFRRQQKFISHAQSHSTHGALTEGVHYLAIDVVVFIAMIYPAAMEDARAFKRAQTENAAVADRKMPMILHSSSSQLDDCSTLNDAAFVAAAQTPAYLTLRTPSRKRSLLDRSSSSDNSSEPSSGSEYSTPTNTPRTESGALTIEPSKRQRMMVQESTEKPVVTRPRKLDRDAPLQRSKRQRQLQETPTVPLILFVDPSIGRYDSELHFFKDSSDIDIEDSAEMMIMLEDSDFNPIIVIPHDETRAAFATKSDESEPEFREMATKFIEPISLIPPFDPGIPCSLDQCEGFLIGDDLFLQSLPGNFITQ